VDRRFPRSRPTVEAEVIGSLSVELCALIIALILSEQADHGNRF
jgi:hypothetical protein